MKKLTHKTLLRHLLPLVVFAGFLPTVSTAQGNLMITPRRVVIEGSQRAQELNLANSGKDTARYLISMIEIRMKEDGTFEQITVPDSGQSFASAHVRFFPRSVKLGPGEAQTVKLQINRKSQLEPGEYRSHLYFRAVPESTPLGDTEVQKDSGNISVKLTPIFGISIPVILRVGETEVKTQLTDASFKIMNDTIPVLDLKLNRYGTASVYGDLKINHISPSGKSTTVGEVKGIAVYTPTQSRKARIALDNKSVNYKSGKLQVSYSSNSDQKGQLLAQTELNLLP